MTVAWRTRDKWIDLERTAYFFVVGIALALCFWAIAAILWLLGGADALAEHGITLSDLLVVQLLGGSLGGLTVGSLYPLSRSLAGAGIVGFVSVLPYNYALITAATRDDNVSAGFVTVAACFMSLYGAVAGILLRRGEARS